MEIHFIIYQFTSLNLHYGEGAFCVEKNSFGILFNYYHLCYLLIDYSRIYYN